MKIDLRDSFWMIGGAVVALAVMLLLFHFHTEQGPAAEIAFKAKRIELVEKMRASLASSSEAEKSAVMATTDQDSQTYADQSRAATVALEGERKDLQQLLEKGGTQAEKEDLAKFSQAFADLQRIDNDLLKLAVSNTNLKAYDLAFGSAAEAIKGMDAALSRIITQKANANSSNVQEDKKAMMLASGAQSAALRIQALLPPHIAEESDAKMDALEAQMTQEDAEVRKDLEALQKMGGDADLKEAASDYAQFAEIKTQILKLSRENTNVQSLAMSLNQKRKAMFLCQDALAALEQTIQAEPLIYQTPVSPR